MQVVIVGGIVRVLQGLAAAAPTLIVGLFIAAVLRYYVGTRGTWRLFGGDSLRALPQAWLIGMLLPVCSIGVIPIIREMRRIGIRPGAITAFALSAPLFNPLSLLYGLTLSRPYVIVGFAVGSLVVVTLLGIIWDRNARITTEQRPPDETVIGLRRLTACAVFMSRELCGPTGVLTVIAMVGLLLLGMALPHGALQSSVEQLDPLAPIKMLLVAVPIYATPMLTMSQLGMMFAHGNSPGAAFCLLLLGTGVNLATLAWIVRNYGRRSTAVWLSSLVVIVLLCAYAVDRPLIPPGVEPAGHTHAFDIYTNPFTAGAVVNFALVQDVLQKSIGWADYIGLSWLSLIFLAGGLSRSILRPSVDSMLTRPAHATGVAMTGLERHVSPRIVGLTCLAGLVAFSVVACYAYYPEPDEVLEEMRLARVEVLSGATSNDFERVLHWIPVLDEWSRKLEVGYAMRKYQLRPYQQMQAHLLRQKLELLEHAVEHASEAKAASEDKSENATADAAHSELLEELEEIKQLTSAIGNTSRRLTAAFQDDRS